MFFVTRPSCSCIFSSFSLIFHVPSDSICCMKCGQFIISCLVFFVKSYPIHRTVRFLQETQTQIMFLQYLSSSLTPRSVSEFINWMVLLAFAEGTLKMEDILQFLDVYKFPLVTTVTELNSVRVFSTRIKFQVKVILLFWALISLHSLICKRPLCMYN